ncbi:lipid IV(A) 3-deoxy-D-manno-octulosonic acid transferase [Pseudoalteromonas sp. T1lg65]|uniref:lipid IV(A) 3-deoxy-D-manno-octulosonic acid transferase n=1 Tax=Pseudoalteromonas sp. T1lg65 TaxID=2077101 RepID=UPI003F7B0CD4
MARIFYSLLLLLLLPFICLYLFAIRGGKNQGYRTNFAERLGFGLSRLPKRALVVHCASVGEVLAAAPLIKAMLATFSNTPIVVTCNTPTGRTEVEKVFSSLLNKRIFCSYLPLDLGFATRRFIAELKPKALVVLETELWPNLFHFAAQMCPTIVVNARLSEKSFLGYQKHAWITQPLMKNISALACHNEKDGERFVALGLAPNKLTITGSIKFDISLSDDEYTKAQDLRLQIGRRPIWLAGSTHPTEYQQLLAAHKQLLITHPETLLIIAPRHPEQFENVASYLAEQQISFIRKSDNRPLQSEQVLLGDTLGELKWLFGCADIAFIGGSLIKRGGHNPLEAAAHGIAIITGPHTYNFAHIYPELLDAHGAQVVDSSGELAEALAELFDNSTLRQQMGINAKQVLSRNQGAVNKTLNVIEQQLGQNNA